jgi:hypothetical protein|tara:strand:+ start:80 stop:529 length:450 start_codon:yes stop_codon:yes gene_type:complete
MANRVLAGNRSSGGYGLYVSRPGNNVLDCANDKLMFNTNSGESGNAFFSAGHFQVVPNAGGTGGTAPTVFSSTTLSAGATATASYQNFAGNKVLMWGSSGTVTTNNSADAFFFTYSGIGTTSATLTNSTAGSLTVKNIAFNLLNSAALF